MSAQERKRVFLLLPEILDDSMQITYLTTEYYYTKANLQDYVLINVYEHFRNFFGKKGATIKSMDMIPGFDELWYYSAFGISKPMKCILKAAEKYGIPMKDLQPLSCKESFTTAYKIAIKYHPSQCEKQGYWESFVNDLDTKDSNPLTSKLLVSIFEYYESIFNGQSPTVPKDDVFKAEFRLALKFAVWVQSQELFTEDFDITKISPTPTPMLQALLNGFQNFYNLKRGVCL